jgi:Sulfotransferase domain
MESIRIAMWSGPRNISTAMMRSWGNRPDTVVVDEPFYAFYLKETGTKHPGAEEVIARGEIDWRKVVEQCRRNASPVEDSPCAPMDELAVARRTRTIFYQKQMTHHLLPEISRDWLRDVTNCFLIRDPARVIASYIKKNPEPELNDLGFVQQAEIFDFVRRQTDAVPSVIDADDVLHDPERMLRLLCDKVGVEFSEAMLSWPPGPRATDGIWAKYWYAEVERSTGFQPYRERKVEVPDHLREIEQRCRKFYDELYAFRLR